MFGTKDKSENDKTPLQDEKQEVIDNIIEEKTLDEPEKKAGVKTGVKRGSYNKPKKPVRKKPKPVEPVSPSSIHG